MAKANATRSAVDIVHRHNCPVVQLPLPLSISRHEHADVSATQVAAVRIRGVDEIVVGRAIMVDSFVKRACREVFFFRKSTQCLKSNALRKSTIVRLVS